MHISVKIISLLFIIVISNTVNAKTIQIEFTEDDTFSKEVVYIDVGDTVEWLPKIEGHNVEFNLKYRPIKYLKFL